MIEEGYLLVMSFQASTRTLSGLFSNKPSRMIRFLTWSRFSSVSTALVSGEWTSGTFNSSIFMNFAYLSLVSRSQC